MSRSSPRSQPRAASSPRFGSASDPARWRAETGENDYSYVVRGLQLRLAALGYLDRSDVTGSADYLTEQALLAFQGWEELDRTGTVTGQTQVALFQRHAAEARRAPARASASRSTATGACCSWSRTERSCAPFTPRQGRRAGARPRATFSVYAKVLYSWSVPFQVWMPYAAYFRGGIATHQSPNVPSYNASHGCVRLPEGEADRVYRFVDVGTPVAVR